MNRIEEMLFLSISGELQGLVSEILVETELVLPESDVATVGKVKAIDLIAHNP